MSAPIKSLASLARDAAKAETTTERRPTRPRVGRFAWITESKTAKEILTRTTALNGYVKANKTVAKAEAATTDRPAANRFAHLKALVPALPVAAPVATQQPRRDGATQAKDEAAAIVERFAKVARIARGQEPAPAAHKPPPAAAALIERMKAVYNEGVK